MRVATVVGTRPAMIRLSRVIGLLDKVPGVVEHRWIHTCQNAQPEMKDQFYADLKLRREDIVAPVAAPAGLQWIGGAMQGLDAVLADLDPDRLLVLGDTNSALAAAYVAKRRRGILVYHVEAGNRCFDPRSPEEINRKVIDHLADVHLCYTEQARRNLALEGITRNVYVVGNPLLELVHEAVGGYGRGLKDLRPELDGQIIEGYYLASLHRAENVDHPERVRALTDALEVLAGERPVILSIHPRLADKDEKLMGVMSMMASAVADEGDPADEDGEELGLGMLAAVARSRPVKRIAPCSFTQWARLESAALCVLTDSGGESEECAVLGTPSVMLRDSTERTELLEAGCSVLAGCSDPERIVQLVKLMTRRVPNVLAPLEYGHLNVAEAITQIVAGREPL